MTDCYNLLADPAWQVISPMIQTPARWRKNDLRMILTAILYKERTGCQWRLLPSNFPCWQTVAYYFYRWEREGLWQRINTALNQMDRQREGREAFPSLLSIDSQPVKLAPRISEHRGTCGGKKVNGRKRHIVVDTGGRIWTTTVTAANVHDSKAGIVLIDSMPRQRLRLVAGDTAYSGRFRRTLEKTGILFELGSRPETEQGFVPIKFRWVVERSFSWMSFHHLLNHDFTFDPKNHAAWILVMNIALCLNRIPAN